MAQPPPKIKVCPNCGEALIRRSSERAEAFSARLFCRRKCHREAIRNGKLRLHHIRTTGEDGFW